MDEQNETFYLAANRMKSDRECEALLREKETRIPTRTIEQIKYKYQMDARSIFVAKQKLAAARRTGAVS